MIFHDDEGFTYATDAEWDRAGAYEYGALHPELPWVSSDRDAWYANPYYVGPPARHPEDWEDAHDDEAAALHKADSLLNDDFPF